MEEANEVKHRNATFFEYLDSKFNKEMQYLENSTSENTRSLQKSYSQPGNLYIF